MPANIGAWTSVCISVPIYLFIDLSMCILACLENIYNPQSTIYVLVPGYGCTFICHEITAMCKSLNITGLYCRQTIITIYIYIYIDVDKYIYISVYAKRGHTGINDTIQTRRDVRTSI